MVGAIVHDHHGIGEIAVHRICLIDGVLTEEDYRAFHLGTGVVVRCLGIELAIFQRAADRFGEADEFRAVKHADRNVAVLHILAFGAVLLVHRTGHLLAVIRLHRGRFDGA